jgi:glycine betaine/proline transport system substrate-binding protein
MKKLFKVLSLMAVLAMLTAVLFGCAQGGEEKKEGGEGAKEGKGKVTLGYVEWDSEIASTHVVKNVLIDMGYDVETVAVDAGVMWTGIGDGDFDAIVSAWLPGTHKDYYEKVKDKVDNLGPNLEGAKIGLVVPEYVTINSIEEMNSVKEKFDGKITGIEPGAGIMRATEKAIQDYGLDFKLQDSSSAAMAASLKKAIDNNDWIVVTGWTPHWKFAKWDLKYLEDPKGIYGGEEHIATIVRPGLKEDMPEVYKTLDDFYWTPADMEAVMLDIQGGMSPDEAAQKWIKNNQDKVSEWTGK